MNHRRLPRSSFSYETELNVNPMSLPRILSDTTPTNQLDSVIPTLKQIQPIIRGGSLGKGKRNNVRIVF